MSFLISLIIILITLLVIGLIISLILFIAYNDQCYKNFKDLIKGTQLEVDAKCIYTQIQKSLSKDQFREFCNVLANCRHKNPEDMVTCLQKYIHREIWTGLNYKNLENNLKTCNVVIDTQKILDNIFKKLVQKCSTDKDKFVLDLDKILIDICNLNHKTIDLKDLNEYLQQTECDNIDLDTLENKISTALKSCFSSF